VNKLITQEFVEYVELFDQELVESVDDSSHNTNSMCFDRVKHLVDANSLDLLSFNGCFDEDLSVDVIIVL